MSEINRDEAINVEFEEKSSTSMPPKKHDRNRKGHGSFGHIILTAVLSFGCGIGGGVAAVAYAGGNSQTVTVKTSSETPSSKVTTVSSSENGKGLTTAQVAAKAAPSVVEIMTEGTSKS